MFFNNKVDDDNNKMIVTYTAKNGVLWIDDSDLNIRLDDNKAYFKLYDGDKLIYNFHSSLAGAKQAAEKRFWDLKEMGLLNNKEKNVIVDEKKSTRATIRFCDNDKGYIIFIETPSGNWVRIRYVYNSYQYAKDAIESFGYECII
jgi:hypothetical protein